MRELQLIFTVLLLIYIIYILFNHLFKEGNSRRVLKHPENRLRQLTVKERTYMTPYEKVYGFRLASDDIYRMDAADVAFDGYSINGGKVLKMRVNGIEMIFPYLLLEMGLSEVGANDVEYAVFNKGKRARIAVATRLNDATITEIGDKMWAERSEGKPLESVLETRVETPFEYRFRQKSKRFAGILCLAGLASIFLCFAIIVETKIPLFIHLGIAGIFVVLMLYAVAKSRKINKPVQSVKRVSGVLGLINYRDLNDAEKVHIRNFIGPSHPVEKFDEALLKDNIDLARINRTDGELLYNPESEQYYLLSSGFTHRIETFYHKFSLRPNKRFAWTSLCCLIFTVIVLLCSPVKRLSSLYTYALDVNPTRDVMTHNDSFSLATVEMSRADMIDISAEHGMDVEVTFDSDNKPQINRDVVRIGAREALALPQTPSVLKTLYDNDFFTYSVRDKVIYPRSITYQTRAQQRAEQRTGYQYLPTNPYRIIEADLVSNPKVLLDLLDSACEAVGKAQCQTIYQQLAHGVSGDEFYFLNQMEDRYDSDLSVEAFKTLFSTDAVWLDKSAAASIEVSLQNWVGELATNALAPESFTNLSTNRGGVILEGENILFEGLSEDRYTSDHGFIALARFYQTRPYHITGLVDVVSKRDGIRHIHLLKRDNEISQQAFATLIALFWLAIWWGGALLAWLIPARYPRSSPRSTMTNHHSPISR